MARKPVPDYHDIDLISPYGNSRFAPLDYTDTGRAGSGVYFGNLCTRDFTLHHPGTWLRYEAKTYVPSKIGPLVFSGPERSALICAPTGAGKGTAIIMPTLLQYEDSVFVIDPKGENCAVTMRRRKELGQTIHVLNPWKERGLPNASINPLDIINPDDREAVSKASDIAHFLVVPPKTGTNTFWDTSAHGLIRGILLYVAAYEREKTLGRVRGLLSQGADDLKKTLDHMASSELYSGVLSEIGNQFRGLENRVFSDVLATTLAHLDFLVDPVVRESLGRSDLSFADLTTEKTSVFVIIPLKAIAAQARWLRLTVGLAIRGVQTLPEGGFNNRCLFLLDEFPALGYMDAVRIGVATLRGYGADFCLAVQDLSQLRSIYGEDAKNLVANCAFKWFSRIADLETATYLSEALGKRTITVQSRSQSFGGGGGGTSTTSSLTGVPLQTVDEILNTKEQLGFLLQSGGPPILIHKAPYFRDEALRKHADPNPYYHPPKALERAFDPASKAKPKRGLGARLKAFFGGGS